MDCGLDCVACLIICFFLYNEREDLFRGDRLVRAYFEIKARGHAGSFLRYWNHLNIVAEKIANEYIQQNLPSILESYNLGSNKNFDVEKLQEEKNEIK